MNAPDVSHSPANEAIVIPPGARVLETMCHNNPKEPWDFYRWVIVLENPDRMMLVTLDMATARTSITVEPIEPDGTPEKTSAS